MKNDLAYLSLAWPRFPKSPKTESKSKLQNQKGLMTIMSEYVTVYKRILCMHIIALDYDVTYDLKIDRFSARNIVENVTLSRSTLSSVFIFYLREILNLTYLHCRFPYSFGPNLINFCGTL